METFWFFRLRFRRAYDSAYDSDFRFSLGHKLHYDFDYDSDSVASEPALNIKSMPFFANHRGERHSSSPEFCLGYKTTVLIRVTELYSVPRSYQGVLENHDQDSDESFTKQKVYWEKQQLCISQLLKPRPPEPRDIVGNLTFTQC